jgi:nucleotide-binding universal stress UspA family protein
MNGLTESVDVLAIGRAVARGFGVRLVLLHALRPSAPRDQTQADAAASSRIEALARQLQQDGIDAEAQIRRARLTTAIVGVVTDYGADIVVMAHLPGNDFGGWLHRTIAVEVLREVPVPVLVVPAAKPSIPPAVSRLRALVPLDGSAVAESPLVYLREVAASRPVEIHVVNLIPVRRGPLQVVLPCISDRQPERQGMVRYLNDIAATLGAHGLATHTRVVQSEHSVARDLLALAQCMGVDLIAITDPGQTAVDGLSPDSIATDMLDHGAIPVLIVPHQSVPGVGRDATGSAPSIASNPVGETDTVTPRAG